MPNSLDQTPQLGFASVIALGELNHSLSLLVEGDDGKCVRFGQTFNYEKAALGGGVKLERLWNKKKPKINSADNTRGLITTKQKSPGQSLLQHRIPNQRKKAEPWRVVNLYCILVLVLFFYACRLKSTLVLFIKLPSCSHCELTLLITIFSFKY